MTMIEHLDASLEAWLSTLDPPVDVGFDRPDDAGGSAGSARRSARPLLTLVLTSIREQMNKRDNKVSDVRATDGTVVARQGATRFFELDYLCSVGGPARDAHRALGDLVQLLVDHDAIPVAHVPEELAALGYPIAVQIVAPPTSVAAVTLRVVLPVEPSADRQIGPPTTSLHLDMSPPPQVGANAGAPVSPNQDGAPEVPIGERKWTTVRRRELIGRQQATPEPAAHRKDPGKKR
jgi:hypothetical protein